MPRTSLESTLTDRYQTTIPEPVRRRLGLSKRDRLRYAFTPDGQVLITRAEPPAKDDPALEPFLEFLARDLAAHPERLRAVDAARRERLEALVAGVEIDLEEPLDPDDE